MKNYPELPSFIEQLIRAEVISMTSQKLVFNTKKLDSTPQELEMDGLKVMLSSHAYGSLHVVESLEFFALPQQYVELGLFLLAATFATDGEDRLIHLRQQDTDLKTIRIFGSQHWPGEAKFEHSLFELECHPQGVKKHPWLDIKNDVDSLPLFNRGNQADHCNSNKEWEERDWLVLSGRPRSHIRLAQLLLKLGHAENHCLEVDLEVEGGFRGVGPLSAEARFWLPGSFGWASD